MSTPPGMPRVLLAENLASGVILHLDRMVLIEDLVLIIFLDRETVAELPAGVVLERWQGRYDRWHLVLPGSAFGLVRPSILTHYLQAVPVDPIGAAVLAQQQQRRDAQTDAWMDTVHPVLGRTPREELAHPGWRTANGHLIWSGSDPHDYHTSIQFMELSQYESVNEDIRYYLRRRQSLHDAVRSAIRTGLAQLRAAAFIVAGMDELTLIELERIEEHDDADLLLQIERELDDDRHAIERAVREGLRRSP